jgi:hypothetical protein
MVGSICAGHRNQTFPVSRSLGDVHADMLSSGALSCSVESSSIFFVTSSVKIARDGAV